MVSFLEYLVFFRAVFCTQLLKCGSRIDFCMFFGILIFDPNRTFWQGYSLWKLADFQNGVISGIFGVCSSGFLHRTTSMCEQNRFLYVFWKRRDEFGLVLLFVLRCLGTRIEPELRIL